MQDESPPPLDAIDAPNLMRSPSGAHFFPGSNDDANLLIEEHSAVWVHQPPPWYRPRCRQLDDPLVRYMAHRNHRPNEVWITSNDGGYLHSSITCDQCYQDWPCATREKLRNIGVLDD